MYQLNAQQLRKYFGGACLQRSDVSDWMEVSCKIDTMSRTEKLEALTDLLASWDFFFSLQASFRISKTEICWV